MYFFLQKATSFSLPRQWDQRLFSKRSEKKRGNLAFTVFYKECILSLFESSPFPGKGGKLWPTQALNFHQICKSYCESVAWTCPYQKWGTCVAFDFSSDISHTKTCLAWRAVDWRGKAFTIRYGKRLRVFLRSRIYRMLAFRSYGSLWQGCC